MKKILALVMFLADPVFATEVDLSFVFVPNTNFMAGLGTNDYTTNLVVNIQSTTNVNTPTNQWTTVISTPMQQYLTQGPVGSTWTNILFTDAKARFYTIQITNYNGVSSSFTQPAPALSAVEPASLNQPLKVK